MLLKIPATRTPQGALKFVALIIKILSCNKKRKKFMVYDQNYHNCSTLAPASEVAGGDTLPFSKGNGLPILKWYGMSSCDL
jgi:hypothetical protein